MHLQNAVQEEVQIIPEKQFKQKMIVPLAKVMILMETKKSKVTEKTKNDLKRQNGF